jgi:GntR family transcriptional regulator
MTTLSEADPLPLYAQLAQRLRARVSQGEWRKGDRLPSHDVLAENYSVARVTVRQAISLLEIDGLLASRRGRGTFVVAQPGLRRRMLIHPTLDALLTMMHAEPPEVQTIDEGEGTPQLNKQAGILAPCYVFLRRLLKRESIPFDLHSLFVDRRLFDRAPERFRTKYVIQELVEMPGVRVATARQIITFGAADSEAASWLGIAVNSPVAMVRRIFCDPNGIVLLLGDYIHPGDLVQIDMAMEL